MSSSRARFTQPDNNVNQRQILVLKRKRDAEPPPQSLFFPNNEQADDDIGDNKRVKRNKVFRVGQRSLNSLAEISTNSSSSSTSQQQSSFINNNNNSNAFQIDQPSSSSAFASTSRRAAAATSSSSSSSSSMYLRPLENNNQITNVEGLFGMFEWLKQETVMLNGEPLIRDHANAVDDGNFVYDVYYLDQSASVDDIESYSEARQTAIERATLDDGDDGEREVDYDYDDLDEESDEDDDGEVGNVVRRKKKGDDDSSDEATDLLLGDQSTIAMLRKWRARQQKLLDADNADDDDDVVVVPDASMSAAAAAYVRGDDEAIFEGADATREFYYGGYGIGTVDEMFDDDDDEPADTRYEYDENQMRR